MTGRAARGLETTNPAMVAAGSYRPSRSKNAARNPFETLETRLFQDNVGGRPWMRGVTAFPLPTRYAPRSQAFSPCRGSDSGSRDSGHRHREPAPAELAAAAA